VLEMIEKCTNTAKQLYNKISQEDETDNGRDSDDDFHKSNNDDNSTYNSEETPINQVAI
jgi:hypothetical protein